jgi:hypothetical protein
MDVIVGEGGGGLDRKQDEKQGELRTRWEIGYTGKFLAKYNKFSNDMKPPPLPDKSPNWNETWKVKKWKQELATNVL